MPTIRYAAVIDGNPAVTKQLISGRGISRIRTRSLEAAPACARSNLQAPETESRTRDVAAQTLRRLANDFGMGECGCDPCSDEHELGAAC